MTPSGEPKVSQEGDIRLLFMGQAQLELVCETTRPHDIFVICARRQISSTQPPLLLVRTDSRSVGITLWRFPADLPPRDVGNRFASHPDMSTFVKVVARLAASRPPMLRNARDGRLVATCVMTTPDSAARRKGLLGQTSMQEGTALIIAPSNAIHTFFMRFAIDVVFVARNGRVVKVVRDLHPWRIAVAARAVAAIELPAGTLTRVHVRRGDILCPEAFEPAHLVSAVREAAAS